MPKRSAVKNQGKTKPRRGLDPGAADGKEDHMTDVNIAQTDTAENPLSRPERDAERRRQHRRSLAAALRDSVTLRNLAHPVRDRDGRNRINALLDDVYDLREDLIAWAEGNDVK
jgi:hypothetical protein